jgi:hypothetical protein
MSDQRHNHQTHGFLRGCPACAQTQADIRRSLSTYALTNKAERQMKETTDERRDPVPA